MVGFRDSGVLTPRVPVPKAAVNENDSLVFRKNDIRLSRQVFTMQPKAEAIRKQEATHQDFGLGVFASYMRHTFPSLLFRQYICHYLRRNFRVGLTGDQTFMRLHESSVYLLYKKCFLHILVFCQRVRLRLQIYEKNSRL